VNRANDRQRLFFDHSDYKEFVGLLREAQERTQVRICAYVLMPNHWHLVLWPRTDRCISSFMHWLTAVHGMRTRRRSDTVGCGHVYQDRFRAFPVESSSYYWNVVRYVEANPLRARLVTDARAWLWSSLCQRLAPEQSIPLEGPMELPPNWWEFVNAILPDPELAALRLSVERGHPYGSPAFVTAHSPRATLRVSIRDLARSGSGPIRT
jgi:putative transposase